MSLAIGTVEVEKVQQGFVKRNGVWQPINTVVGDIWEHLSRGKDLKDYAEMVSEASGRKKVMHLSFYNNFRFYKDLQESEDWLDCRGSMRYPYSIPEMWFLVLDRIDNSSVVCGDDVLYPNCDERHHLVGVAQEGRGLSAQKGESLLAPEAQGLERARGELLPVSAREKSLDARVQAALDAGKAFEFNGVLYAPVSGVSLK